MRGYYLWALWTLRRLIWHEIREGIDPLRCTPHVSIIYFVSDKSWADIFREGFLRLNSQLPHYALPVCAMSQQLQTNPGFILLPKDWDLPGPIRTVQWVLLIYIKWSYWRSSVGTFATKGGLPFVLLEHNVVASWVCVSGTIAPFAQINALYSLL